MRRPFNFEFPESYENIRALARQLSSHMEQVAYKGRDLSEDVIAAFETLHFTIKAMATSKTNPGAAYDIWKLKNRFEKDRKSLPPLLTEFIEFVINSSRYDLPIRDPHFLFFLHFSQAHFELISDKKIPDLPHDKTILHGLDRINFVIAKHGLNDFCDKFDIDESARCTDSIDDLIRFFTALQTALRKENERFNSTPPDSRITRHDLDQLSLFIKACEPFKNYLCDQAETSHEVYSHYDQTYAVLMGNFQFIEITFTLLFSPEPQPNRSLSNFSGNLYGAAPSSSQSLDASSSDALEILYQLKHKIIDKLDEQLVIQRENVIKRNGNNPEEKVAILDRTKRQIQEAVYEEACQPIIDAAIKDETFTSDHGSRTYKMFIKLREELFSSASVSTPRISAAGPSSKR